MYNNKGICLKTRVWCGTYTCESRCRHGVARGLRCGDRALRGASGVIYTATHQSRALHISSATQVTWFLFLVSSSAQWVEDSTAYPPAAGELELKECVWSLSASVKCVIHCFTCACLLKSYFLLMFPEMNRWKKLLYYSAPLGLSQLGREKAGAVFFWNTVLHLNFLF